ncbi:MAG TPA: hypothetical protein PKD72_03380 [Gemmatales bacterium]|nr:hypothetical protein [Gemmatales bacterium]
MQGYLFCDDLMWLSRVMAEARESGCKIIPARNLEQLQKAVSTHGIHTVIVDLSQVEVSADVEGTLNVMKSLGLNRFVAYGSHIETAELAAARNAGCHPTLARSKMAVELGQLLPAWLSPASSL